MNEDNREVLKNMRNVMGEIVSRMHLLLIDRIDVDIDIPHIPNYQILLSLLEQNPEVLGWGNSPDFSSFIEVRQLSEVLIDATANNSERDINHVLTARAANSIIFFQITKIKSKAADKHMAAPALARMLTSLADSLEERQRRVVTSYAEYCCSYFLGEEKTELIYGTSYVDASIALMPLSLRPTERELKLVTALICRPVLSFAVLMQLVEDLQK